MQTLNCVLFQQTGLESRQTVKSCQPVVNLANSSIVSHVHIVQGQSQRKGASPAIVRQCSSLRYVNNASCIDQLCSVKLVPNVPNVAQNLPLGARLNQYPDDWLVRARSHQTCLQHTQTLVALGQDLVLSSKHEKSELDPKQVFDFVGYQFNLKEGKVRPTLDWWQTLTTKIRELLNQTDLSSLADASKQGSDAHLNDHTARGT